MPPTEQCRWVFTERHDSFLAEVREHFFEGWNVTWKSLLSAKPYSQKTVAGLYPFMKCCGSCQFLHGLWMDMSGEVAEIHMRTDAKNLVIIVRIIYLLEQKETQSRWFPCCERKPVQGVFMILLTLQLRIVWQFAWRSHRRQQTIWVVKTERV